jgi:molecular chaperone IbpA
MNKINTQTLPTFLNRRSIGFDAMFNMIEDTLGHTNTQAFPPYNLIQKDDDNFAVEVAIAGFGETDITITKNGNKLTIAGSKENNNADNETYLHRGISSRSFTRDFVLAEHVDVTSASMTDGILVVELNRELPASKKPQTIKINS